MSDEKTYAQQIARENRDAARRLPEHMQPSDTSCAKRDPAERMARYDNEGKIIYASLIAAAPELLAACESALNLEMVMHVLAPNIEKSQVLNGLDVKYHFDKIRAAILRARGEE